MSSPLVSIITPLFNSEKFISETIESVLSQTYKKWELIIVNDNSTDKSVEIINKFIEDERIKIIHLKNNFGPAYTRNIGIENSIGEFIAFLDSDDLWLNNKLEVQLEFMQKNNLGFTFSKYNRINESGEYIGSPKSFITNPTFDDLTFNCMIGCLTVILNRSITGKIRFPEIIKRQDHGLWLKLYQKGINPVGINDVLAKYRVRKKSVSSNKFIAAKFQWKLYREIMNFNLLYSITRIVKYFINGLKNRI